MKEYPIIFSGEMVRAILGGDKTQTRRVIKPQPSDGGLDWIETREGFAAWQDPMRTLEEGCQRLCPYGMRGQKLWVREAWYFCGTHCRIGDKHRTHSVKYAVDGQRRDVPLPKSLKPPPHQSKPKNFESKYLARYPEGTDEDKEVAWNDFLLDWWRKKRPSIHMPRWASRITLEVEDVRVERVQDISEEDAAAEGTEVDSGPWESRPMFGARTNTDAFCILWDGINAKRGYPWSVNPFVWAVTFKVLGETDV